MAIKRPSSKPLPPESARIVSEEALQAATLALHQLDPDCMSHMLEIAGPPPLRARSADLSGLVSIVISQQVSTASARAIHARFQANFGHLHHRQLLEATDEDLRACGLSSPKMRTMRALGQAIEERSLDLDQLSTLTAGEARARMTAVKGIGPWTADIYLLFCLGHPDIWPAGDLALQEGVRMALKLRARPDARQVEKLSRRWQPFRAAAARLIWAYYAKRLELKRSTVSPGRANST